MKHTKLLSSSLVLMLALLLCCRACAQQPDIKKDWRPMTAERRQIEEKALADVKKQYQTAEDRLAFLLSHVESEYNFVLCWVADQLGNFNDPRSIAALEKLATYKGGYIDPDWPDFPYDHARKSLEKLAAAEDLAKLRTAEAGERVRLIEKYLLSRPYSYYARGAVRDWLVEQAKKDPQTFLPLLVKYEPRTASGLTEIILQHQQTVIETLPEALKIAKPTDEYIMGGITYLAGMLKARNILPQLVALLDQARLDLSGYGDEAVPLLEVTFLVNRKSRANVLSNLARINSHNARAAMERLCQRVEAETPKDDKEREARSWILKDIEYWKDKMKGDNK